MIGYIYQIINNQTQERYVGQTINLVKRLNDHKNKLNRNCHVNPKLQNAWNEYGEENFSFVYDEYEIVQAKDLDQLEINTIKQYDSYYHGYNLTLGGGGGNTRGKLSFEDYCFIYIGCQWPNMTDKISKYLNIDSSTTAAILRAKAYLWYKEDAENLPPEQKEKIIEKFRMAFGIDENKPRTTERVRNSLSEEDYFYCLCVASCYGRGIEATLGRFFEKHKSFLSNGMKNKTKGHAYEAKQRFIKLSKEEIIAIGQEKFKEWELDKYSTQKIAFEYTEKWRQ